MLRTLLGIFLIINVLNLSVQLWTSSAPLAELNEEVEQVIEDPVFDGSEPLPLSAVWVENLDHEIKGGAAYHERASICDYFEIDSPPPELT